MTNWTRLLGVLAVALMISCSGGGTSSGPVVVELFSDAGVPIVGATVVRHGKSGLVRETALTGSNGSATIEISRGEMVTVAWNEDDVHLLRTRYDVRPGEVL